MQKITKIVGLSFEGGGGKTIFSTPNISPNFGVREPNFLVPLEI